MKNLLRNQEGALGMILVIGFMALAVPLITASLFLSGALSRDSQVKTDILKRQYAALGIGEYVDYLVSTPALWDTWKTNNETQSPGTYQEIVTIDGKDTTFTVNSLANPPGIPPAFATSLLSPILSVSPTGVSAGDTVTFTITVNNQGTELEDLSIVSAGLPPGFSYVDGSTTGVATLDPTETTLGALADDIPDYPLLTWDLTSLGVGPQPGQSVALNFQTVVADEDGNFCAQAWLGASGGEPSAGSTAQVTIGEADDPCGANLLQVTTTVDKQVIPNDGLTTYLYTYSTTIKNVGTETQYLTGFREILPLGFDYKINSTSGDLTTDNPVTTLLTDGRWQLDWTFSSAIEIQAGVTKSLVFQAEALVAKGNYPIEGYAFYKGHGVRVHKDSTVAGDLVSAISKVKVDKATNVNGKVRAGGKIDLKKNVVVQNGVIGGDEVKLDQDVIVTGDVFATGDVDLKKDASINGDVCADGNVQLAQGASVTGSVACQPGVLTIVPADLLSPATLAAGGSDIEVAKNGSLSLSPGSYGELRLKQNATLDLVAGQYAFEKVTVDKDSNINFNLTDGQIVVDIAGSLKFQKKVTTAISSLIGSPSDVKFRAQSSIDLHKDATLVGTFLSLGGKKEVSVTWPTAIVRVMDVFQVSTTNANGEIGSFEAWVGLDSGLINRPIIDR